MIMLFKGNSSRLEHLIEKIQANKENHDVTSEELKGKSPHSYRINIISTIILKGRGKIICTQRVSREDVYFSRKYIFILFVKELVLTGGFREDIKHSHAEMPLIVFYEKTVKEKSKILS